MDVLLKNLPKEDLPRERLQRCGVKSLSNEELIAILLRTGTKNASAKTLANSILSKINSISDLEYMGLEELSSIKGLGLAKSTNLIAAIELGRRVSDGYKINKKLKIKSSIEAYNIFGGEIKRERQENFLAIYLDTKNNYITHKILFKGTLNTSIVHPREVIKEALLINASSIIIMHNHPSGETLPSKADDEVTSSIAISANMFSIKLLDHIIVGLDDYYSYMEDGRLKYE